MPRERPPFSAPNFRYGAYNFYKLPKNPFRSITILHFLADFAVPETIIFKISLISTRSSPPTAGSARTQSVRQRRSVLAVPEIRIFTLKTAQARSGAPHFQAQSGSSSFRSPAFSRSTGSLFQSPGQFFTLPRHIPTKIWGEYPPPPPSGANFFSPNRFAFYSVKATCIKTTGIKLSIFQLRLQVQVQFIMAKDKLLAMRGLDLTVFRSKDQSFTNTPRTSRCN